MRIAIVSDMHIGSKARGLDLCPHVIPPEQKALYFPNYLADFLQFLSSGDFISKGPIDILCVTGDISHSASPSEFSRADEVLKKIAVALKVGLERVYFVPGNHDVHWPVAGLDPIEFWKKYRYEPLMQPGLVFHSQVKTSKVGAFDALPHFVVWSNSDHLVVGLNSAAY